MKTKNLSNDEGLSPKTSNIFLDVACMLIILEWLFLSEIAHTHSFCLVAIINADINILSQIRPPSQKKC